MSVRLKVDFVSDVSCPWCIIGLRGLEEALERTAGEVTADITFQPFELNPGMPPEGQNIVEHVAQKYGSTPEQSAANRAMLKERAASVGFDMAIHDDSRIYNTFDAHRLLHWAENEGRQLALKHALFELNFTENLAPSDHATLIEAVNRAGLDADEARSILASDRFARAVHDAEEVWRSRGIQSVPAVIINDRYLVSGGQPPEAFEQALRQIASETAAAA